MIRNAIERTSKSEVGRTDDKIQDYTITNGASYFFPLFFDFSLRNCIFKYNKRP